MPVKDINTYTAKRHVERRAWAIELLGGGRCVSCGTGNNLEFDHTDPDTKSFNIGQHLGRYSKKRLLQELLKCQLLCYNCHKKKTGFAKHGTRSSYTAGCRCSACTEANKTYYQKYWLNKRATVA